MQGFFGWKNASMCQKYISTSRPAIMQMAQTLGSFELGEPEAELEVHVGDQVEPAQEDALGAELDLCDFVMDVDPELYETAGILLPGSSTGLCFMDTIHGTVNF
jgi:hypothetical protein